MNSIFEKNLHDISKFEFTPKGWREASVKDVCVLGRGRVISQEEIDQNPGEYPVYSSQTSNKGIMGFLSTYDFNEELVTWTTDGANAGTVFHRTGKFNCTNVCGTLKPKSEDEIDLKFLSYHLGRIAKGYVSYIGNPKLMNDVMSKVAFALPNNKKEQRKIAKILTTVDNLIEKTEALIEKYQAIKQGMMYDLFARGIDTSGQLRPSRHDAPHLYKPTELGWIPKEWDVVMLADIASVDRGKFTHRPRDDARCYGGQLPFIQTGDVTKSLGGSLNTYSQTLSEFGASVSRSFPSGTVAVTIAANIADTAILGTEMYFPDSVVGVVPKAEIQSRYVELCIRRNKRRLDARAPLSAQKNINLEDIRPLKIPLPGEKERAAICMRYEAVYNNIEYERIFLSKLLLQKKGLMQDLLTGEVRVN